MATIQTYPWDAAEHLETKSLPQFLRSYNHLGYASKSYQLPNFTVILNRFLIA
jgi:hypothetical protein